MTFCFLVSTGKPGGVLEGKENTQLYYNQITALSCQYIDLSCHVVQSMMEMDENNMQG